MDWILTEDQWVPWLTLGWLAADETDEFNTKKGLWVVEGESCGSTVVLSRLRQWKQMRAETSFEVTGKMSRGCRIGGHRRERTSKMRA